MCFHGYRRYMTKSVSHYYSFFQIDCGQYSSFGNSQQNKIKYLRKIQRNCNYVVPEITLNEQSERRDTHTHNWN